MCTYSCLTYTQQEPFFALYNYNHYPRQAFCDIFSAECRTWIKAGDQIIMMVDLNEDVTFTPITQMLHTLGLNKAIINNNKNKNVTNVEPWVRSD